jgi:hypothetical protein
VVFMGCYVWCLLKFKLDLLLRKKEQDWMWSMNISPDLLN